MRKALTFILALMLMACSKSSDETEKVPQGEEKQPMLSFYVYAPEHADACLCGRREPYR